MEDTILTESLNRVFVMVKQIFQNDEECRTIAGEAAYNRVFATAQNTFSDWNPLKSLILRGLEKNKQMFIDIFNETMVKMRATPEFIDICSGEKREMDINEKTNITIRLFIINYNRGFLWVWTPARYEAAILYEASLPKKSSPKKSSPKKSSSWKTMFTKKGGKIITKRNGKRTRRR